VTWKSLFMDVWGRGQWAILSDIAGAAVGSVWPWVTGYFLGVEMLGLISVALLATGQVVTSVPVQYVLRSVLPRTTTDPSRMHDWVVRSMRYSVWMLMGAGVGMIAVFIIASRLFFPQYEAALPFVAAFLVTLPIRGVATVAGEWFFALGLQKSLFATSTVPKVVMLVLLPPFLMLMGPIGFLLWYVFQADAIVFMRLKTMRRKAGRSISFKNAFSPEQTDYVFFEKARYIALSRIKEVFARGASNP